MKNNNHLGNRTLRSSKTRVPSLGYYLIITDTKETEKNYFLGLRDSLPQEIKDKIVIKVINTNTNNLIDKANELRLKESQFQKIWIIFDRDRVVDFDSIIKNAESKDMAVGWSNPCFEIWLQAYLGKMPNYSTSVKCVEGFSKHFEKIVGKKYNKNSKTIYQDLKIFGNEEKAIDLANLKHSEAAKICTLPSKMSPSTKAYQLVAEIKSKIK